ncbi:MAG TPA: hypothetical protein DCL61_07685 [Cyanobacteria bacterium UBA12227]|nr:hypothetical protein [Cyanobacteria bacterium UBA12227]
MRKWFPWWKNKLSYYVNALSKTDQEALAQLRIARQNPSGDSLKFLWIGRWVSHKGTDILLDFITQWTAIRPQDNFTIAGCGIGAEKDCPVELIQSGKLKIIPSFERTQLCSLLANHHIGLFTSKVEGWGLVLNEMLESGMPVFATPVGGVSDLHPFFKEKLKLFPPSLQLIKNVQFSSTTLEEYYRTFTWEKIGEAYRSSLLESLESL